MLLEAGGWRPDHFEICAGRARAAQNRSEIGPKSVRLAIGGIVGRGDFFEPFGFLG
jgi:hypothetical protein